ncbi:MAG: hypothetical protein ACK43N_10075, partial [Pirellulaceae bacterium]
IRYFPNRCRIRNCGKAAGFFASGGRANAIIEDPTSKKPVGNPWSNWRMPHRAGMIRRATRADKSAPHVEYFGSLRASESLSPEKMMAY